MKHEIDQQGNIILKPTTRDIDIISRSLATKHVQLRATQATRESLEEILSLMVVISDAKADSKRASLTSLPAKVIVPIDTEPKKGWGKRLKDAFHPPFSTLDFEEATTVCGLKHFIYSMDFNASSQPTKVCGEIYYEGRWFAVQWNQNGKCICPSLGPDAGLYNLNRPGKQKLRQHKRALMATSVFVIILITYLTIQ